MSLQKEVIIFTCWKERPLKLSAMTNIIITICGIHLKTVSTLLPFSWLIPCSHVIITFLPSVLILAVLVPTRDNCTASQSKGYLVLHVISVKCTLGESSFRFHYRISSSVIENGCCFSWFGENVLRGKDDLTVSCCLSWNSVCIKQQATVTQ